MSFQRWAIFLGAVWSAICLVVSLLGGIAVLQCGGDNTCTLEGSRAAALWSQLVWWTVPLFGAGVFFGFRSTVPHIRAAFRARRHQ